MWLFHWRNCCKLIRGSWSEFCVRDASEILASLSSAGQNRCFQLKTLTFEYFTHHYWELSDFKFTDAVQALCKPRMAINLVQLGGFNQSEVYSYRITATFWYGKHPVFCRPRARYCGALMKWIQVCRSRNMMNGDKLKYDLIFGRLRLGNDIEDHSSSAPNNETRSSIIVIIWLLKESHITTRGVPREYPSPMEELNAQ